MTTSIQGPRAVSRAGSEARPARAADRARPGRWPSPSAQALPLERILPSARGAGRERRLEVVEQHLTVVVARPRHRVPLRHPVEGVVPAFAALALLRDDLEPVAGRAGIERLLAPLGRRIVLGTLVTRREGRSLRRGGTYRERQRNRREGAPGA